MHNVMHKCILNGTKDLGTAHSKGPARTVMHTFAMLHGCGICCTYTHTQAHTHTIHLGLLVQGTT